MICRGLSTESRKSSYKSVADAKGKKPLVWSFIGLCELLCGAVQSSVARFSNHTKDFLLKGHTARRAHLHRSLLAESTAFLYAEWSRGAVASELAFACGCEVGTEARDWRERHRGALVAVLSTSQADGVNGVVE
eukprot:IDg14352t1